MGPQPRISKMKEWCVRLTFFTILLCLGLAGCGGSSGSTGTTTTSGGTGGGTGGTTTNPAATSPPGSPTLVSAGTTGVNITVPGPSQNPTPNAQLLGTAATDGSANVSNTGDVIHRGTTPDVLISGPGISATSTVRISGPGDIIVTDQGGITDGTTHKPIPGIRITLNVPPNATLGLRTVFIITGNDMTTFTGGLEVVQ
jgi:hypothetical protein